MHVEHHAALFAWLACEASEQLGPPGEDAIRAGVRRYGEERGQRMAALARADDQPTDFVSYLLYGEIDFGQTRNVSRVVQRTPFVEVQVTRCDWHQAWLEQGALAYGRLYCQEIDCAILRGFDPNLAFSVAGTLTNGAPCCRFLYHGARMGLFDTLRYRIERRRVGSSALRSFDWHTADLYRVLSAVLVERLGVEGERVAAAARRAFAAEYGDDAAAML